MRNGNKKSILDRNLLGVDRVAVWLIYYYAILMACRLGRSESSEKTMCQSADAATFEFLVHNCDLTLLIYFNPFERSPGKYLLIFIRMKIGNLIEAGGRCTALCGCSCAGQVINVMLSAFSGTTIKNWLIKTGSETEKWTQNKFSAMSAGRLDRNLYSKREAKYSRQCVFGVAFDGPPIHTKRELDGRLGMRRRVVETQQRNTFDMVILIQAKEKKIILLIDKLCNRYIVRGACSCRCMMWFPVKGIRATSTAIDSRTKSYSKHRSRGRTNRQFNWGERRSLNSSLSRDYYSHLTETALKRSFWIAVTVRVVYTYVLYSPSRRFSFLSLADAPLFYDVILWSCSWFMA